MINKFLLISMAFILFSCGNKKTDNVSILSGKLANYSNQKELTLSNDSGTFKKDIKINEDGTFLDTISNFNEQLWLFDTHNRIPLFFIKGNDLSVNYDLNNFKESLKLSGNAADYVQYYQDKNKILNHFWEKGTTVYTLDEKAYKNSFKNLTDSLKLQLKNAQHLSAEFKKFENKSIEYKYLGAVQRYQQYHRHYTKVPDFNASSHFLDELKNLNYNNEADFKFSSDYRKIVKNYFSEIADKKIDSSDEDEALVYLKTLSLPKSDYIKNELMYGDARYAITYTNNLEGYYKYYMNNSSNKAYKEKISESYNKLKTVAAGSDSPVFKNYENYKGGTNSLTDFKGSYVYIDVWATWCGPCKREIPFLKKMETKYHNNNIKFISISIDEQKDHDKWIQMVKDKNLQGVQLFADNNWNSDFVKAYLIKGIPRFILVDPKGKIVNANAPRPSEEKFEKLLKSLNI
ncbi:MAG: TlpA family protein disulfide reductase [Lutibacter sp.]